MPFSARDKQRVKIFLVPTGSARSTSQSRALRGTFRQETKLPGWFVGSEQQSCHWATVNLSQSAPLLSWFIEGVNNRGRLGIFCKAQNLKFLWFYTPLCLQSFISSSGELRFLLAFRAKGCWKGAPLLHLHGVAQRMLIFTDWTLNCWVKLTGVKRQLGQAGREELELEHPAATAH